ncbi:MAG: hypothetical protein SGILL_000708 [Bacillariaceae sp.]
MENVIKPNFHYECDYFVHFFNITSEQSGRSGKGGAIDPSEVMLLRDAIHELYAATTTKRFPKVKFASDTDEDFYRARNASISKIENYPVSGNTINTNATTTRSNPYYPTKNAASFDATSTLNILKMWHTQTRVFELMESEVSSSGTSTGSSSMGKEDHHYSTQQYTRVAMLRLDVVYMTPIDIYKVPNDPTPNTYGVRSTEKGSFWKNGLAGPIQRSDYYFYDLRNNHAVIPGFASFPINDRLIMGPYDAVKIWACDRWKWMEYYVETVLKKRKNLAKFGLHDERFIANVVVPKIRKLTSVRVMVDRNMYFFRVRADGSIWILDCPFQDARFKEPKKLELLLGRSCLPVQKSSNPVAPFYVKCPVVVENATMDATA